MIIGLAGNASEATSSKTLGLVAQDLAVNAFGWVTMQGQLAGLDTSAATAGDPVWLGTTGTLLYGLTNKPYAPAHLVSIGIVTRSNNSNGEIEVRVQNGFELHEIHDVDTKTSAPTSGQYLKYNGSLWVNSAIAPADVTGTAVISTDPRLFPSGGLTGQILQKSSGSDYATTWGAVPVSQNFLINGGFDIWQRGTSSTTTAVYITDRWLHTWNAGTATASRSTDVPVTTLPYSFSLASASGTNPAIQQRIEAVNALPLVEQTVTFSIWAKSTVGTGGLTWTTYYPTTTVDTFSALTGDQSGTFAATMTVGTWTRYSATFTVNSGAVRGYVVQVFRNVTTTSTTTLYAGAQLEVGTAATSFRRNAPSIQAELAACQRYYANMTTGVAGVGLFSGFAYLTTNALVTLQLPVTMRVAPVLVLSSASHFNTSNSGGGGLTPTSISNGGSSTITYRLNIVVASGYTAGQGTFLSTASTSAVLAFNAEL
jgi:hypothetical protein